MNWWAVFGAGLHVSAPDVEAATAAIQEALQAQNIAVKRLQHVEPSLEDAFISLILEASDNEGAG